MSTVRYCSIADIKAADTLGIYNPAHDAILNSIILAVSRRIDDATSYQYHPVTEIRYYTAESTEHVQVDGIGSVSGFALATDPNGDGTFETTWSSTDYVLAPYNALLINGLYTCIERALAGVYGFPTLKRGVKVTASFGYTTVPPVVKQATVMQTLMTLGRTVEIMSAASLQVVESDNVMTVPELDDTILKMLSRYRKYT